MDPKISAKVEDFRKAIAKEDRERKKNIIRKSIYDSLLTEIDESSNGTNSRSSRFPIKSGSSKERPNNLGEEIEESNHSVVNSNKLKDQENQVIYLEYLKNLSINLSSEDNELIEETMTEIYGRGCFRNMEELRSRIFCDLLGFESICSNEEGDTINQKISFEDWRFIAAAYKIAQNENFPEITRSSFTLMTCSFNQWYLNILTQQIEQNKNSPIEVIFNFIERLSPIEILIEELILSKLLLIQELGKEEQTNSEEEFQQILRYLGERIDIFEKIEKKLLENYDVEETEHFSEMIFHYGFLNAVESLAYRVQSDDNDSTINPEIKVKMFMVINKYFTKYPFTVESETETQEKFNLFIYNHLQSLITFFSLFECSWVEYLTISREDVLFQWLESSEMLIHSLLWRDSVEENYLYQIETVYRQLINCCLTIDGMISRFEEFRDFHMRMMEFSFIFFSFVKGSKHLFSESAYIEYISLLALYFHEKKIKLRNNISQFPHEILPNLQEFYKLEVYLIYAIYFIKSFYSPEYNGEMQGQFLKLIEYTEFVYGKEYKILNDNKDSVIVENCQFIFAPNIKLYFQLFCEQNVYFESEVQNPESTQTTFHENEEIEI